MEPTPPTLGTPPQSEAPTPTELAQPKPHTNRKRAITIAGVTTLVVVAAIVGYLLVKKPSTTASVSTKQPVSAQQASTDQSVNGISSIMTNGANGETGITNTNNSGSASDASGSAATIGDSIDENSF